MKKFFPLLLILSSLSYLSYAQNRCATDEIYQKLKREHPEIGILEEEIENSLTNGGLAKFANKATSANDTTIYDVPIVVHIIHDFGQEYMTDDAIFDAFAYWNTVYLGQNYADTSSVVQPFKKWIGNPRIRLHLATIDPNGKPTKGITRHQSYLSINGSDEAKLDYWPQNNYVNVWFINTFGAAATGAAAYSYYPSAAQGMPYYDGVISLYSYIDVDKTIPHELGHVFNLEHPWGNTNNPGVACGDDGVDDTPPTKGHYSTGCSPAALYDTDCATGYLKHYTSVVTNLDSVVDYPDTVNSQNIMDYTYCSLMFTRGQAVRIRTALLGNTASRNNLYKTANLNATGALAAKPDMKPIAAYSVESTLTSNAPYPQRPFFLCADYTTNFKFKNQSWNDTITAISWNFSNAATVPSSTSSNFIQTKFMQPGWVTLTMTATSNAGIDTLVDSQAVYVADTLATAPGGYVQNFTSPSTMSNWPMFNFYKNNFKWEWYNGTGYNDAACVRYRSFDYRTSPENKSGTPEGDNDDMYTPGFDLQGASGQVYLNFYTAGAHITTNNSFVLDTIDIWASTNCGGNWTRIARTIGGATLANNGTVTSEFIPASSSQWTAQTISVPASAVSSKTFFRFRYKPGNKGNDLYFDKFSISGVFTEVLEVMNNPLNFKLYPNPSQNGTNLVFMSGSDGRVKYEVRDVAGKIVYKKEGVYTPNIAVQEYLSASMLTSTGMYFVTVQNANGSSAQKLVIY